LRYIKKLNKTAKRFKEETGKEGTESFLVQAKLSMLEKKFHKAEALLLQNNDVETAMEM